MPISTRALTAAIVAYDKHKPVRAIHHERAFQLDMQVDKIVDILLLGWGQAMSFGVLRSFGH